MRRMSACRAFIPTAAFLAVVASACATMGADAGGAGAAVLAGTVRVVGNEPFSRTVVTVAEGSGGTAGTKDHLIVGPLEKEIRARFQGKRVRLEGEACESQVPSIRSCFKPSKIVGTGDE